MSQLESTSTIEVINAFGFLFLFDHFNCNLLPLFRTDLFWKSPELLRQPHIYGSQKGDVYAFAIILFEIIGRHGPFGYSDLEPIRIVELVRTNPEPGQEPFRPDIESVIESETVPDYVINCVKDCWEENPELRPDFPTIRCVLLFTLQSL